jgi:hypothetical protein
MKNIIQLMKEIDERKKEVCSIYKMFLDELEVEVFPYDRYKIENGFLYIWDNQLCKYGKWRYKDYRVDRDTLLVSVYNYDGEYEQYTYFMFDSRNREKGIFYGSYEENQRELATRG